MLQMIQPNYFNIDGDNYCITWLVTDSVISPNPKVAFYDRASGAHQQYNGMRGFYGTLSEKVSRIDNGRMSLVKSGDERGAGVTFLDVGTGIDHRNRPAFDYLLSRPDIDIIIAVAFDRLARREEAGDKLEDKCKKYHKWLGVLQEQRDIDFFNKVYHLFNENK